MGLSIRGKINSSFLILVMVFVVNGITTIVTLNKSKALSDYISKVIDPAQQERDDLEDVLIQSKMYATNWTFLRTDQEDKIALKELQAVKYPRIKSGLNSLYDQLRDRKMADSLTDLFIGFEQLIAIEKHMMVTLSNFTDYDDPVKKLEAEQLIEDEVIPRTAHLINRLTRITAYEREAKIREFNLWETYSNRLRVFITILTICLTILAVILSKYFTAIIIDPINKIRHIVNDLGKGITRKIEDEIKKDEIGDMIQSVNRLSQKLEETATFAEETGKRKFSLSYTPLSNEDTLGKALLKMRENLKTSEEEIVQTASYLIQRNKDLEQFSYIVSHNLRSPLANIGGLTELMQLSGFEQEHEKELVGELAASVKKLDSVIMDLNNILQIKHTEGKAKETIKLSDLLSEIKLSIDNLMKNDGVVIVSDFSRVDELLSIKGYLYSIFLNLISNSIKYRQADIAPVIEITSYRLKNTARIVFKDNGLGIDMEKRGDQVFGLYKRFHSHVDGKGMGLYMVKTQVESLGGKISISSEVNKGTEFRIEFEIK
ncbi:MAG: hypothetical protein JWQ38_2673 [Flavipsychrobacter sp.]|nr:hypothetical protein [Flavipsychrobacter sp.]